MAAPSAMLDRAASPTIDWTELAKDAVLAAVIAGLLALPFVGLETYDIGGGALGVRSHFDRVAIAVLAVLAGRFALQLSYRKYRGRLPGSAAAPMVRLAAWGSRHAPAITIVGIAFAVALPFLPFSSRYLVDLGTTVLIYVMLGWGLNIVVGLAGLLDLGYVAFYAVGAYTFALLARDLGFTFWEALPFAGLVAASFGILLGFPVLRLRGDYLAIVTLAFGEIIRLVITNWQSLTGGPNGIGGIPRPSFFGIPLTAADNGLAARLGIEFSPTHRIVFLFYIILALALLTNWVTIRLRRLPIGRAWEALREDEVACRALGINITTTKLTAFATGAMFGGFAGAFFATRQGFISPESFTFQESALVLAIVVLGGMGSQLGVALAALTMIGGFELFRGLEQYRMLVFGVAMVLLMIWRPRGLIGHRAPTVFLRHAQAISSDLVKEGHG